MKDQVDVLCAKGVQAASLDSSQTMEQSNLVKSSIRNRTIKILYVAPERLSDYLCDVHIELIILGYPGLTMKHSLK